MRKVSVIIISMMMLAGCGSGGGKASAESSESSAPVPAESPSADQRGSFDADSAYSYVRHQVEFGPRVPGSEAHRKTATWLEQELRRHGADVVLQRAEVKAFDGTTLPMTNIMGSYNPDKGDRLLLLAHYDTRPWADKDADASHHDRAIDGANDGGSGVGVLLEIARQLGMNDHSIGVDILFVDCEDYGSEGDDDSWALGARYFATHPIKPGYAASRAILLDMVGDKDAVFPAEYFSRRAAPDLDDAIRKSAISAGHGNLFPARMGGAVTDDHVELIKAGIPAIDIIDYRENGFCPTWHTMDDNMEHIDKETLRGVGETLTRYLETEE